MPSGRNKQILDAGLAAGFDPGALRRSDSVSDTLAANLREHIVMLRLKPTEAVSEAAVAEAYGVGRTIVREAFGKLESLQLVRRVPQSGSYVTPISARLVREGGFVRLSVEEANIRDLASKVTPAQISELRDMISQQETAEGPDEHETFHKLDEAFHQTLFRSTDRANVWTLLQPSKLHVDRARIATLDLSTSANRAVTEHRKIVDAIEAHDVDEAGNSMRRHLQRISILMNELVHLQPAFVVHD